MKCCIWMVPPGSFERKSTTYTSTKHRSLFSAATLTGHFYRNIFRLSHSNHYNAWHHASISQEFQSMSTSNIRLGVHGISVMLMAMSGFWCVVGWFEYLKNCWFPWIFTHRRLKSLHRMVISEMFDNCMDAQAYCCGGQVYEV